MSYKQINITPDPECIPCDDRDRNLENPLTEISGNHAVSSLNDLPSAKLPRIKGCGHPKVAKRTMKWFKRNHGAS